jgi:hypothetical protein
LDKEARKYIITYIYIQGLWIEGARWFKVVSPNLNVNWGLTELPSEKTKTKGQKQSTDLRSEMSLIKLLAMHDEKNQKSVSGPSLSKMTLYSAQVDKNSSRTDLNYIFKAPLQAVEIQTYLTDLIKILSFKTLSQEIRSMNKLNESTSNLLHRRISSVSECLVQIQTRRG